MAAHAQTLSVVVPVYFEEAVIETFYLRANLRGPDRSLEILVGLHERDPRVKMFFRILRHPRGAREMARREQGGLRCPCSTQSRGVAKARCERRSKRPRHVRRTVEAPCNAVTVYPKGLSTSYLPVYLRFHIFRSAR